MDLQHVRSYLFVPANKAERIPKALASGADAVIVDLEDSVGVADKGVARRNALEALAAHRGERRFGLRINAINTQHGLEDLLALRATHLRPSFVVVPRVECKALLALTHMHLQVDGRVVPLFITIETARGLESAPGLAEAPGVRAIGFGAVDLASQIGIDPSWEPLLYARSRVVQAAAMAGIPAVDAAFLGLVDHAQLADETARAKAMGFSAKVAIHPAQLAPIHHALAPTAAELSRARDIIAAFEDARGNAVMSGGSMVDKPVMLRAQRIVLRAQSVAEAGA